MKFNATVIAGLLTALLSGCAAQPTSTALNPSLDNARDQAIAMTPSEFNAVVAGVPEQDEFEAYRDMFDAYVTGHQAVYYADVTLANWHKNPLDASEGYYLLTQPMGESTKETQSYEFVNEYGELVQVAKTIVHADKINFDKKYIATNKENGRALKGETVRVFYTLATSDDYLLKKVTGPQALCKPAQLTKPTYFNPRQIILTGCQLQANVIDSVLLSSGEPIDLAVSNW